MKSSSDPVPSPTETSPVDRRRRLIFILALAQVMTALVWAGLWTELTHTLDRRPDWISVKPTLSKGLLGARCYTSTPITLAGHHLNVAAWSGFQEVLSRELDPVELDCDVLLGDGDYFSVIYNKTPAGFSGLRFSRSPIYNSIRFTAGPDWRFLSREPLDLTWPETGWQRLRLVFNRDRVEVRLGGRTVTSYQEALASLQRVGFRGGPFNAYVDNVLIKTRAGDEIRDSFSPRGMATAFFILWGGLIFLLVVTFFLSGLLKASPAARRKLCYAHLAGLLTFILLGGALYAAQRWHLARQYEYSSRYFLLVNRLTGRQNPIELRDQVIARLRRELKNPDPEDRVRIMFVGTSQTWGAGASQDDMAFVHRLEELLNQDLFQPRFQVLNTGISAERSPFLFEQYSREWIDWAPQVVVINLSNNDIDPENFRASLENFAELNRERGIITVFSLEANNPYGPSATIFDMHAIMKEVAREQGTPLIDFHGLLAEHWDQGFLWWDNVHLTDFGHELAAEIFKLQLMGILKEQFATKSLEG